MRWDQRKSSISSTFFFFFFQKSFFFPATQFSLSFSPKRALFSTSTNFFFALPRCFFSPPVSFSDHCRRHRTYSVSGTYRTLLYNVRIRVGGGGSLNQSASLFLWGEKDQADRTQHTQKATNTFGFLCPLSSFPENGFLYDKDGEYVQGADDLFRVCH